MAAPMRWTTHPFERGPAREAPSAPVRQFATIRRWIACGAIAGAIGTFAMTVGMEIFYRLTPLRERQPLMPSEIVQRVMSAAGSERALGALDQRQHAALTLAAHLGYGMTGGIAYPFTMRGVPLPPLTRGAIYGVGVYALSYLGWLPSLSILRSATTYTPQRALGLLAVHLVYGSVTALVTDGLLQSASDE